MHDVLLSDETSLEYLEHFLEDLPSDSSETTIENNRAFINRIGQPAALLKLIQQIMDDDSALAAVAGRSYRHVNHFDKIVLIGNDKLKGYRLTLHMWNPPYSEDELNEEMIHDHRFNFWSMVLTGTLTSENFSQDPAGTAFREYRYIPEKRTRNFLDFYEFMGEKKLLTTEPSRKYAGESYYLSAPRIHRVLLPRDSMTCTLVLRGPRQRSYANVYNTEYPPDNTQFDNSMFSAAQVRSKLSLLTDEITRQRLTA